jgi:hypothetical protein
MTRQSARRLAGGLLASCIGIFLTCWGLVLERDQLVLAMQLQSMKPICDPSRNAVIAVLLPVITFGGDLLDYGIAVFLLLFLLNSLLWAAALYIVGRTVFKLKSHRGDHSESAA